MIPAKVIKNIQVLCFWARERERAGQPLLAADFTAAALAEAKETMRLRDEMQQEALSIKPDKFRPNQWTEWSKHFTSYLSHTKGVQYAPLDYVICTEPPHTAPANMNQRERALYQLPLNGRHCIDDNNTVYRLLCDLLIGTPGYVWVEQYDQSQNGRDAWMALVEHYEGGGQREKHESSALATLRSLHYKNESVFSFEDFSRKLVRAYRDLEGTEEAYTPYNKVQTLLTKIEITLPLVEVAKAHVRSNHRLDIDAAIAYLSTEFAKIFADAMSFRRGRSQIHGTSDDRDDGRHIRQRTDDGPTRRPDGTFHFFGVDVTEVCRDFSDQEMSDLGPRGQAYIFQERRNMGFRRGGTRPGCATGQGRGRGRGRFTGRYVGRLPTRISASQQQRDDVSNITDSVQLPSTPTVQPPQPPTTSTAATTVTQTDSNTGSRNGTSFGAGAYQA